MDTDSELTEEEARLRYAELFAELPPDLIKKARDNARRHEKLDPTRDIVFKALFSKDTQESKTALASFISAVIGKEAASLRVVNPELLPEYGRGKLFRLDVMCTFNGGETADIEMQVGAGGDDQIRRSVAYGSRLLSGQMASGEKYMGLERTYMILVSTGKLFPQEDGYRHRARICLDSGTAVTDVIEWHYLELGRVREQEADSAAGRWLLFFKYFTRPDKENLINDLCAREGGIKMASETLQKMSGSYEEWLRSVSAEWSELMYERSIRQAEIKAEEKGMQRGMEKGIQKGIEKGMQEGIEKGMQEGIEKGMQEGMREERLNLAKKLIAKGYGAQEAAELTGLSVSQIEQLAAK